LFVSLSIIATMKDPVTGDVSEVKTRRTARSERSGLTVHEHREYGTTQYSRRATNRTEQDLFGL
ncbi:hypothetical protein OGY07_01865, partial [Citrobacter sp. Cs237]|uniref:hypothetical protein n=1 Tax=Citrobacter sp. Cs237 TaxID=2985156 RepID=UPI002575530F